MGVKDWHVAHNLEDFHMYESDKWLLCIVWNST